MPIGNINPSAREIVMFQRDDTNTFYNETHISGSNLIIYVDDNGYINADPPEVVFGQYPVEISVFRILGIIFFIFRYVIVFYTIFICLYIILGN